jgi:U3 small nucleolar RNA-associated protein 15
MTDGTLSVRRRQPKASEADGESSLAKTILQSGTYDSFLGGSLPTIGEGRVKGKGKARPLGDVNELRIESRRTKRLKNYDKYLKSFKYSAALDAVLKKVIAIGYYWQWVLTCIQNVPPTITFALIQELIHRDGLRIALSYRDDVLLEPVLRLLVKYVSDPRFGEMVCDVAKVIIGKSSIQRSNIPFLTYHF